MLKDNHKGSGTPLLWQRTSLAFNCEDNLITLIIMINDYYDRDQSNQKDHHDLEHVYPLLRGPRKLTAIVGDFGLAAEIPARAAGRLPQVLNILKRIVPGFWDHRKDNDNKREFILEMMRFKTALYTAQEPLTLKPEPMCCYRVP